MGYYEVRNSSLMNGGVSVNASNSKSTTLENMHTGLGKGIAPPAVSVDGRQHFGKAFNYEEQSKHNGPGHLMQAPFSPGH